MSILQKSTDDSKNMNKVKTDFLLIWCRSGPMCRHHTDCHTYGQRPCSVAPSSVALLGPQRCIRCQFRSLGGAAKLPPFPLFFIHAWALVEYIYVDSEVPALCLANQWIYMLWPVVISMLRQIIERHLKYCLCNGNKLSLDTILLKINFTN